MIKPPFADGRTTPVNKNQLSTPIVLIPVSPPVPETICWWLIWMLRMMGLRSSKNTFRPLANQTLYMFQPPPGANTITLTILTPTPELKT